MKAPGLVVGVMVALSVVTIMASGQVARQALPQELNEFHSPMVVDVSLAGREWTSSQFTPDTAALRLRTELAKYICDDVSMNWLLFSATKDKTRGNSAKIVIDVTGLLTVRPSHDRRVDLIIELVDAATVLSKATLPNLDAEEGQHKSFATKLTLNATDFEKLKSGSSTMSLRLTMSVREG